MGRGKKREDARKPRRSTPEERRQAVEAFRKSGLTQAMFAKQWGVNPITFSGWVARAGAKDPRERRGRKPRLAEAVKQEVAATKRRFPTFGFLKIRDFVRRFRGIAVAVTCAAARCSAAQLDRELPRAQARVDRATFYAEARSAMKEAVLGLEDPDEIRKAEQDAIWRTLERHGLARRHVGLRRTPCPTLTPVATGPIE
jgi:transposase-like protein